MTAGPADLFADTAFWLALIIRQDAHHARARDWATRATGRIVTTEAVLIETASALARPLWRPHAVRLIDNLRTRHDVDIVPLDSSLLDRGWELYRTRLDKSWSWVDCVSFVVMEDLGLKVALKSDRHFEQAGFRAVLGEGAS